ncbi:MAG TPA: cyanophycin synthetase, partial [Pyrinomonadaceae bacterium]|nr:cyanophycin synthetase [Pyrinomonadaceae bacterium]
VKLAFRRFMNLVPANGKLIAGWDSPNVRAVVDSMGKKLFTTLETFGTTSEAKWQIREPRFGASLSEFKVFRAGELWGEFRTPLLGGFNLLNCLAVIVAADTWGVTKEKISDALETFKNVKRRAEVRGEKRGIIVIDDFAHHPTAVRETLRALHARYEGRRLVAVFEPRSWSSRLAVFQKDYADAFTAADYVVIASVFDSQKVTEKGRALNTAELIEDISKQGKPAFAFADVEQILSHLVPDLREGDVVAIMSNGGFGGIHDKLLAVL